MHDSKRIVYHDLREEALAGRLPALVGREEEMERLDRIVDRRISNNALIVGESGSGKTALAYGWMRRVARSARYDPYALLQLDSEHVYALDDDASLDERYAEAFAQLPPCILFLDDLGREARRNTILMQRVYRLYKRLLTRPDVHMLAATEPRDYARLGEEHPAFARAFETVALKNQAAFEYARILSKKMPRLNARRRAVVSDDSLSEIVSHAERFPSLGQLPRSAIHLLDECLSFSASRGDKILTADAIARVVETKTGVPHARLSRDDLQGVRNMEDDLNACIVDQKEAMRKIATTLQRAKLGLRNPDRPLGSFLLLGPSGVGKTETAKRVAEIVFGRPESFTRIDMSEFQQDHTVGRLIGAPPGYVGYDEGGALTNALSKEPYSLILLDEIEKAHPKVFDVFLQVLDDGRLTSGRNETVDARNAIVMATSNAAVAEILKAHAEGADISDDMVVGERVLPILTKTFRPEFINRFDAVLVFKPLATPALVEIARLEIAKIEKRLAKHRVRFEIEPEVIADRVRRMADPRFGARPVKRFIEETCETLLAQSLLS